MSRTLDQLRRRDDLPQVRLRLPNGIIQGPMTHGDLADMAAQNRISPGSEVSRDGENWLPADKMKNLKMEWTAALADGSSYGPFNLLAAPILVQQETIAKDAQLTNQITGKTLSVHELVRGKGPARKAQSEKKPKAESSIITQLEFVSTNGPAPLESNVQEIKDQLDKERNLHEEASEAAAEREVMLNKRVAEIEAKLAEAEEAVEKAQESANSVQSDSDTEASLGKSREMQMARHVEQAGVDAEASAKRVAQLGEKLKVQDNSHRKFLEEAAHREKSFNEQIQQLRKEVTETKRALQQARRAEEQLRGQYEEQVKRLSAKDVENNKKITQFQSDLSKTESLLEENQKKLELEHRHRKDIELRAAGGEAKVSSELTRLKKQTSDSRQQTEELRKRAEEKEQQYSDLVKESAAGERELKARLATLEKELGKHVAKPIDDPDSEDHNSGTIAMEKELDQLRDELTKLRGELDREKTLHAETSKAGGNREKQFEAESTALKKKAAEAGANLGETSQEVERQRQRYVDLEETGRKQALEFNEQIRELKRDLDKSSEESAARIREANVKVKELEAETISRTAQLEKKTGDLAVETRTLTESLNAAREGERNAEKRLSDLRKELSTLENEIEGTRAKSEEKLQALREKLDKAKRIVAGERPPSKLGLILGVTAVLIIAAFVTGRRTAPGQPLPEAPQLADIESEQPLEQPAPEPAVVAATEPNPVATEQEPVAEPAPAAETVATEPEPEEPVKPTAPAWAEVKVDGVTVTQTDESMRMVFDEGTFAYMTVLKEAAKTQIKQITEQTQGEMQSALLIIEGHTDSITMSGNAKYTSNGELGLARAQAAAQFLIRECGMRATQLKAESPGEAYAPYPNDTPESRRKNRTVILKLVRIRR